MHLGLCCPLPRFPSDSNHPSDAGDMAGPACPPRPTASTDREKPVSWRVKGSAGAGCAIRAARLRIGGLQGARGSGMGALWVWPRGRGGREGGLRWQAEAS